MSKDPAPVCELYRKNSLFCASGMCPDEEDIPEGCNGVCMILGKTGKDNMGTEVVILHPANCKLWKNCPCARPADARRLKAFNTWLKLHKHRCSLAKAEKRARHRVYVGGYAL